MDIAWVLNGEPRHDTVPAGESLLDMLRRLGLYGTKNGCGSGDCGSCTVLLDGRPVPSCLVLAARAAGHEITTIEGLGTVDRPHPLQQAFAATGAVQCGYCIPGSILSSAALLAEVPAPTEAQIRRAMDGNLCRCTGYVKKVEAVERAAEAMRSLTDDASEVHDEQ
jgi:aerobic-type carbon monoxide dehydrogenase small subunit (CoxS/CutS family)